MNWLDLVLLGLVVFSVIYGMRVGLIGSILTVVALLVSWLIASQLANFVGNLWLFGAFGIISTLLTVSIYCIVMALVLAGAHKLWSLARPALGALTLGLSSVVDKLGGLVLGLLIGVMLAGVLTLVLIRLTYDLPTQHSIISAVAISGNVRVYLENALSDSQGVEAFIRLVELLSAGALGFIPSDFAEAIDILKRRL